VLAPTSLPVPDEPILGAPAMHRVLVGWRELLNGTGKPAAS